MKLYLPITVDLYNIYPLPVINTQQYNIGRGALITLVAAGQMVVPDKETIYVYSKKKDGTSVYATCEILENQVKVDFDEQMLAVQGIIQMELQMVDSIGNNITTPIFQVNVQKSNIDFKAITSSNEFQALQEALKEVNELKEQGLKGDPGEAATIQIGDVTASNPGSVPVVTNTGTENNAVLNFVLPRGETGPKGDPGDVTNAIDPVGTTKENIGEVADAYYTGKALAELNENMNKCVLLFDRNITNTSTEYAINDDVSHFRIIIAIGSKNADKVIRGYATVPVAALTFFNGVYVQESMPGNITDLISLSFFGNKISTYYRGEMSHLRIYGMF